MRISVTELESWRLYEQGDEWVDYHELVNRMTPGVGQVESDAMRFGTAFHAFLEDVSQGTHVQCVRKNGINFKVDCEYDLWLPPIREVKVELPLTVDGMDVMLVGKADALTGPEVFDHKLVKTFDVEKYLDSLQWRSYLMMFEAKKFTYNIFESDQTADTCRIRDIHQFSCCRYPGIEQDVIQSVRGLARFLRDYVPVRIKHGDEKRNLLLEGV